MIRMVCVLVVLGLSTASGGEASPAKLGFVPDAIANQLGGAQVVVAMDVEHFNLDPWLAMIPAEIGCVRDLVKSIHVVAFIGEPFVVFATGLTESQVRRCLRGVASLDPSMGTSEGADGTFELEMGKDGIEFVWRDDVVIIREAGTPLPPNGQPSAGIRALAASIPPDAKAFLVATKFTKQPKIKSSVGWLRVVGDTAIAIMHADSSDSGIARALLHDAVDGFKEAFATKHVHIDESWFQETSSGTAATLEVHLPLAVLRGAH